MNFSVAQNVLHFRPFWPGRWNLLSEWRIFRGVAEPVAEVAEFADVLDSEAIQRDNGLLGESFLISIENHRLSLILSDF